MVNIIKAEHQKAKRTMRKKFIWGFPPYIVKSFFLENQGFFSVSSINISEEGAIGMDISLYLVRK